MVAANAFICSNSDTSPFLFTDHTQLQPELASHEGASEDGDRPRIRLSTASRLLVIGGWSAPNQSDQGGRQATQKKEIHVRSNVRRTQEVFFG